MKGLARIQSNSCCTEFKTTKLASGYMSCHQIVLGCSRQVKLKKVNQLLLCPILSCFECLPTAECLQITMVKALGLAGLLSAWTLVLFLLLTVVTTSVNSEGEVVGCGGFVRTSGSKNIDVTRIQVALFSKKGGNLR